VVKDECLFDEARSADVGHVHNHGTAHPSGADDEQVEALRRGRIPRLPAQAAVPVGALDELLDDRRGFGLIPFSVMPRWASSMTTKNLPGRVSIVFLIVSQMLYVRVSLA